MKKEEQNKTWKIIKIVLNVLLWVFVAFAVAITILVFASKNDDDNIPTLGGRSMINILTDSMSGTVEKGDIILAHRLSGNDEKASLKVGDIITFKFNRENKDDTEGAELNTHRIIEVKEDASGNTVGYTTHGDHNPQEMTEYVLVKNVVAKWDEDSDLRLRGLGSFLNFLQTSEGFLIVIVLPLLALFLFELVRFVAAFNTLRNKNKNKLSAEEEEEIKRKAVEEFLKQQETEKTAEKVNEAETGVKEIAEEVKETADETVQKSEETVEEAVEKAAEETVEEVKSETENGSDN